MQSSVPDPEPGKAVATARGAWSSWYVVSVSVSMSVPMSTYRRHNAISQRYSDLPNLTLVETGQGRRSQVAKRLADDANIVPVRSDHALLGRRIIYSTPEQPS